MKIRLFTGLAVSTSFISQFELWRNQHNHLKKLRWTIQSNLHLTSLFIGEIPSETLTNIKSLLKIATKDQKSFELTFETLKLAPNNQNPRMIWAKYQNNPQFENLFNKQSQLFDKLTDSDILTKHYPTLRPHVTLARFKENTLFADNFDFQSVGFTRITADKLILFQSLNQTAGPIYKPLEEFCLSN